MIAGNTRVGELVICLRTAAKHEVGAGLESKDTTIVRTGGDKELEAHICVFFNRMRLKTITIGKEPTTRHGAAQEGRTD